MDNNELLMIVLAFFLGFCFRKTMAGQLIEGSYNNNDSNNGIDASPLIVPAARYLLTADTTPDNIYTGKACASSQDCGGKACQNYWDIPIPFLINPKNGICE